MNITELAAEISQRTGLKIGELEPVEGGMDSRASSYRTESYFIKLRPELPDGAILASRLAVPGVLGPLQTLQLSDGSNALVYEYIDAHNGFERMLTLDQWEEVGTILRQVHDFVDLTLILPREQFTVQGVDTLASSRLSHLVELRRPQVDAIIKETQSAGRQLSGKTWRFVPCHADLHVGNILSSEHNVWLVDWDTARFAPCECDLVFFLGKGILGQHGQREEEAFLRGYGEATLNPEMIRYYQLARVLEDLVAFAQEGDETWFLRQFESHLLFDAWPAQRD